MKGRQERKESCAGPALYCPALLLLQVNQESQVKTGYQVPLVFLDPAVKKGSKVLLDHLVHRAPLGSPASRELLVQLVNLASCVGRDRRVKTGTQGLQDLQGRRGLMDLLDQQD